MERDVQVVIVIDEDGVDKDAVEDALNGLDIKCESKTVSVSSTGFEIEATLNMEMVEMPEDVIYEGQDAEEEFIKAKINEALEEAGVVDANINSVQIT